MMIIRVTNKYDVKVNFDMVSDGLPNTGEYVLVPVKDFALAVCTQAIAHQNDLQFINNNLRQEILFLNSKITKVQNER